jgi:2-polyprenyl-3-methyl-5-hydroxy-6-metoxy-1,4-benzoquinol methylase
MTESDVESPARPSQSNRETTMYKQTYEQKAPEYFSSARREILPLLPANGDRVLELGCGNGATLRWIKELGRFAEFWGIELTEVAGATASAVLDHVIIGDVEDCAIEFPESHFELILCLDVLEHLRDPWAVMDRLSRWLCPGGVVVASIPNVRYYTVLRDLVFKGSFRYEEMGILDRTHLRFFTRESGMELMRTGGLQNIQVLLQRLRACETWRIRRLSGSFAICFRGNC